MFTYLALSKNQAQTLLYVAAVLLLDSNTSEPLQHL
jgi:hypothetical protein